MLQGTPEVQIGGQKAQPRDEQGRQGDRPSPVLSHQQSPALQSPLGILWTGWVLAPQPTALWELLGGCGEIWE